MRMVKATFEGYRSLRDAVELRFDPLVTVILGANDHGKTNILDGMLHLNPSAPFVDEDLNWDRVESRGSLPRIRYELYLTDEERTELRETEHWERAKHAAEAFAEAADDARNAAQSAAQPTRDAHDVAVSRLAELDEAGGTRGGEN